MYVLSIRESWIIIISMMDKSLLIIMKVLNLQEIGELLLESETILEERWKMHYYVLQKTFTEQISGLKQ